MIFSTFEQNRFALVVGVPKEIKSRENRIGLVPAGVRALRSSGHKVLIEKSAGIGSGITDQLFERAGASMVCAEDAWSAEMVIKVKEPLPTEFRYLRQGQILFTYLHLAAEKELTVELMKKGVTGIAYETIQKPDGSLPLLRPMSEVAGKMAIQVGAFYLQSSWDPKHAGRGVLLGGVTGVAPGRVTIIGGGVAGSASALMALGLGASVTIVDVDVTRLEYLSHITQGRLNTLMSNLETIEESVSVADLVVGSVLVPGARAPKLVTRKTIAQMTPGSVAVDIAVDQGGCMETCRPTTHEAPTFIEEGVIHYCVTNMPGAVARTSTFALTNVTLPYAVAIGEGVENVKRSQALRLGFNTHQGKLVHQRVAEAHGLPYTPLEF